MFRKFLVSLVALSFIASALVQAPVAFADGCTSGGDGSVGSPYLICTPAELQGMSTNASGDHYLLGADIDLSHTVWTSFDLNAHLDGNGHTISNLHVIDDHGNNTGLFNTMALGSELKKVFIKDAEIRVYSDSYVGVIAGYSYGSIDQVKVTGNIYSDTVYSSGIVGYLRGGSITNVDSGANITNVPHNSYAAGISPFASGTSNSEPTISNSLVTGRISTDSPIGTVMWGMPWWNGGGNPPMPSCSVAHQIYVLDSSIDPMANDYGCRPNSMDPNTNQQLTDTSGTISLNDLKSVTNSDSRFTGWNPTIWDFGSNLTVPHLAIFPVAPDQPGVATVTHSANQVGFLFVAPTYNGGSAITGYDVQVMPTIGNAWLTAGITTLGSGQAAYTGIPNDGTRYIFRYRAYNVFGASEWASVSSSDYPSTTPSAVARVIVKSSKLGVKVSFTDGTNNGGSAISSYVVSFYRSANTPRAWKSISVKARSVTLSKLKVKTKLWVSVSPVNRDGAGTSSPRVLVTVKK